MQKQNKTKMNKILTIFLLLTIPNITFGISPASVIAMDKAVEESCTAIKDVASLFHTTTTNTMIGEDACLGFNDFNSNTSTEIQTCLDTKHLPEYISLRFDKLNNELFNNDTDAMKAELLAWKYDDVYNRTIDQIQWSNSATSSMNMLTLMKNIDHEKNCVNLFISEYYGTFNVAEDVQFWRRTSSSLWSSSSEDYIKYVPHKLTLTDMKSISMFAYMLSAATTAEARGLNYTWPSIELGCKKN
jgi:hypothetical protein